MSRISRRHLLRGATGLTAAAALAACDTAPSGGSKKQLKWWDQFKPLSDLEEKLFAEFTKDTGIAVDYTVYNPEQMGQSLQLAQSSKQLPDVFTLAGVGVPPPRLVAEGWFSPMRLPEQAKGRLPDGALIDGLTLFDGKTYSFPQFSFRQYASLTWYNKELFGKAGLDPESPPATYDDFRAAARAVKKKGGDGVFGFVAPLQFVPRLGAHVIELAQAAGAAVAHYPVNFGATDLKTGAYAFHTEPFLAVFEFLLSLKKDKTLFPASSSLDARKARARWSTGAAGLFFDGPWNIGVIADEFSDFAEKVAVGSIPMPESGTPVIHHQPTGGTFWVAKNSKLVEQASKLLGRMLEPDYQRKLAENMDQPPIDLAAVEKADVHPTYRTALNLYREQVLLAPSPTAKNPKVADVQAEMKDIHPSLGEIVQGAFSGDISDVEAALKKLSSEHEAEREKAIKKVTDKGVKVSVDDWAFPDWDPGKDYGPDSY